MRSVARLVVVTLFVILLSTITAESQVTIGINIPLFPQLVSVPGYPVYYAPSVPANYFFYDGLYWVFNVEDGYWYSSSWYNGPWVFVSPMYVPQPILVVPYRYYRVRPAYWGGWEHDRPPHWGQHWGPRWESDRHGWDQWDRNHHYNAAPLPDYQKRYDRDHYPSPSQQVTIHNEQYHYQPQDEHVRQQQPTILQQESRGGAKAPGRAEGVTASPERQEKAPQPAQHQEKAPHQEKAQPAQHQENAPPTQQHEKAQPAQQHEKAQPQPQGHSPQGGHEKARGQAKSQDQGQENGPSPQNQGAPER